MDHAVVVDAFGITDCGRVRETNQDHFLIATVRSVLDIDLSSLTPGAGDRLAGGPLAHVFLVADGVGGQLGGGHASGLAVQTITQFVTHSMQLVCRLGDKPEEEVQKALEASVFESDVAVRSAGERLPQQRGMATTLTVAHVLWPRAYVVQVGDTRCYLVRQKSILQVTKDQTVAQGLVEEGVLAPGDVDKSRWSHVLSSAIGMEASPVTSVVPLQRGDALLLCSDGLTKHVSDPTLAKRVRKGKSAQAACKKLLQDALDGGGSDNITVVVARFD